MCFLSQICVTVPSIPAEWRHLRRAMGPQAVPTGARDETRMQDNIYHHIRDQYWSKLKLGFYFYVDAYAQKT